MASAGGLFSLTMLVYTDDAAKRIDGENAG
jgi:hypothetical protein